MKLLILGASGMAGHMLVDYFKLQSKHQVFYTTRDPRNSGGLIMDASDIGTVDKLVEIVRPDCIINAIGVLNHFAEEDKINAYHINGFLPHRLRRAADSVGARLIHISTDCVFEGTRGGYRESDVPDGTSVYAMTKALGEVQAPGHLTIRTSIIGPEIRSHGIGLMHWFMHQRGTVTGYCNVFWNGVTTLELAKAIDTALFTPSLSGLIHLAHPEPISKHDLLLLFQEIWNLEDVTVVAGHTPVQDRTLVSTRGDWTYKVPPYRDMLKELKQWMRETTPYSASF
ncbi:NAD(P)-dependent oxidoreductase [Paenibacillus rhizosphaerae]|uniref:dTDP-4-dehydrorhamnose reductase n=1 Tax=Paenibacillus rhizosphaerae TaxID=297318 RepID=A0A1R1EER2_9BACL|nr:MULTISPECIES: SDR family oxidoreductase [Paenibacillus]OMF50325.1 NAD(P)-dependent oxidoreductase [Paenibacillus rhizosphaerae]UYO07011.1 SDR family oxidoreductase [Paenibacillus sp. PSB04]